MLTLPKYDLERNEDAEDAIVEKTRAWLEGEGKARDPRIHASDLLRPRKAYWSRQQKEPVTPQMAGNFMVGKVLHAFFSTLMNKKKGLDLTDTDVGGTWEPTLGISYSNDHEEKGIPYEYKTSRALNEQTKGDLSSYMKQLCIYMAAKKVLQGRLVVLRLNAKNKAKGWGTFPQFRAYQATWTKKDMVGYRTQIVHIRTLLETALKSKKPKDIKMLEVCEDWMCGKSNCGHYSKCKPEGRFGTERFDK